MAKTPSANVVRITKTFVDKVEPPTDGNPVIYWDQEVRNLGLRVMPSGKRTYFVQGRCHGVSIKFTLGAHWETTPDDARQEAKDIVHDMRKGIDPRDARKAKEAAAEKQAREDALDKITLTRVMEDYIRDRPRPLKPNSIRDINRHVTKSLAEWADLPISAITDEMVDAKFQSYKSGGFDGKGKPAPQQAKQCMITIRALFRYAMDEYHRPEKDAHGHPIPLITRNPTRRVIKKLPPTNERDRRIPDDKVGAVWNALWHARRTPYTHDALTALDFTIFLMLTGARRGEAGSLRWSNVNLEQGWWHIANPKRGKPLTLPLSTQAIALLAERQKTKTNDHAFDTCSRLGFIGQPQSSIELVTKVAGTTISCHDLRRTFTQIAFGLKIELPRIELMTGHKPSSKAVTLNNYIDTNNLQNELRAEVQQVADWIVEQARLASLKTA